MIAKGLEDNEKPISQLKKSLLLKWIKELVERPCIDLIAAYSSHIESSLIL